MKKRMVRVLVLFTLASWARAGEQPSFPKQTAAPAALTVQLNQAMAKNDYRYGPVVRAAYLALARAEVQDELQMAKQSLPRDFLVWVDSDPVVQATVYGSLRPPVDVLRVLYSLDQDLGSEVVRKEYTQLALAMAVWHAQSGPEANLTARPPMKLVIPENPCKRVDTKDPSRTLDENDHIINFLNDYEQEVTIPAQDGQPERTEMQKKPLAGYQVLKSKDLVDQFNAYMKAKGQPVSLTFQVPRMSGSNGHFLQGGALFRRAYQAKGYQPAKRDAAPTVAETCAFLIRNDRFRFPPEAKRAWPLFPLKAPWPTLTMLAWHRDPLRECEDMWQQFVKTGRPTGSIRYMGWIAQHGPTLEACSVAPLDFASGSVQKMKQTGGVCGTQSGSLVFSKLALGVPGTTQAQPGHCGYVTASHHVADDTYYLSGGAYANAHIRNFAPWCFSTQRHGNGATLYPHSTFWACNCSFPGLMESMLAYCTYLRLSDDDRKAHGYNLIGSGLEQNPYNMLLTDAAENCSPMEQFRLFNTLSERVAKVSAERPGCKASTCLLKSDMIKSFNEDPLPQKLADVKEIYAFIQAEKNPPEPALSRYRAAVEGLDVVLGNSEAEFKAHLASERDPTTCKAMALRLDAAGRQIADLEQRKEWVKARQAELAGREDYFFGKQPAIGTDDSVHTLARLARKRTPTGPVLLQTFADALTVRLQALLATAPDAKALRRSLAEVASVQRQMRDTRQRKAWRQSLDAAIGDRMEYQDFRRAVAKVLWTIRSGSSQDAKNKGAYAHAIDGSAATLWRTRAGALPQEIVVDMHEEKKLTGFTYLPWSEKTLGAVDEYAFDTSLDGKTWTSATTGTFARLTGENAPKPTEQRATFAPATARYFRLTANRVVAGDFAAAAEIGVVEAL